VVKIVLLVFWLRLGTNTGGRAFKGLQHGLLASALLSARWGVTTMFWGPQPTPTVLVLDLSVEVLDLSVGVLDLSIGVLDLSVGV